MSQIQSATLRYNEQGTPVSNLFDDVYFSNESGLDETQFVFLHNNQLPERWQQLAKRCFHVIETGFGTGLNFLVCWQAFRQFRAAQPEATCQQLHFSTFEKFPLTLSDLTQALTAWPTLQPLIAELLAQYPRPFAGCHRLQFDRGAVTLDLWLGDIKDNLPALPLSNRADAWFLDGFAPSKNPDMWQDSLFEGMARLSGPGTTVATFTSAGIVRRGLQSAGFLVKKVKGFGRKREMAVGVMPAEATQTPQHASDDAVTLVGGGIAALLTALALIQRGRAVRLLCKDDTVALGASHNRQGALYPQLQASFSPVSRFHASAYGFACRRYRELARCFDFPQQFCGVLTLACTDALALRQTKIQQESAWPAGFFQALDAQACSEVAGLPLPYGGLFYPDGGWIAPQRFCLAALEWLMQQPQFSFCASTEVLALHRVDEGWYLDTSAGHIRSRQLVLCNGVGLTQFAPTRHLPLNQVRGQVSHVSSPQMTTLRTVICHQGYITPADTTDFAGEHCVGATFDRTSRDTVTSAADDAANLALVNSVLRQPTWFADATVQSAKTGLRATVPDHLPIAGEVTEGLYVLGGLGARGLLFAPLLAEQLAADLCQQPVALPDELQQLVSAARFDKLRLAQ
ncbi:MAG: bifunctional tRNA (5-methylaminomethyl-2-thiouridine)(34)-methyltransferase MnmD/FAD-dependent 5-carboxymethylaminomethyl-2-thiouridine(34) oxidoreductase MnmC [Rheinheimera sp.]|nr:bifunctional tRNA (5-methylaminomethyl-2-thiouridine)(34)-methyltransferase MnmD/FAD-dependent 5-carboxymethylaminomethyl-2-thiouridine(34) oxidoreductase MnmC [Rheinheimera sp.]